MAIFQQEQAGIQELLDRSAITDLVYRLGLWLDDRQFERAGEIFTEDAEVESPGGVARGLAQLTEQARRNHMAFAQTHHVTTNILIDLRGDRADIRANLIATMVHRAEKGSPFYQLGERYEFAAARTDAGWRFTRVKFTPVWTVGERQLS